MGIVVPGLGAREACHEDVVVNAVPGLRFETMSTLETHHTLTSQGVITGNLVTRIPLGSAFTFCQMVALRGGETSYLLGVFPETLWFCSQRGSVSLKGLEKSSDLPKVTQHSVQL